MFNKKYLVIFLALLIACMSVVVAADVDDSTADTTVMADDTPMVSNVQEQTTVSEDNIITKETRNLKQDPTPIIVNSEADFNNLFDSDGYLTGVTDGSTIKINADISKNDKSYIINKAINLTSDNNNTIDLNTSMGYNLPNSQLHYTSFNFVAGAAGSNITNIHFHNTEIYVNNTNSIVFDGVSVTVTDNTVGTEVGIMSIRDDSTNITVKNSYFNTNNNGGYSTLVLAGTSYSTIDNNTIIGSGTVGNLLYLTTYNVANIAEDDIELNSYNNITNNTISRAEGESDITYGITLTGHDNLIANNIVNIYGQGITTQWAYTDPATPQIGNNSERYKGNYYYNNTVNNGASFKATNNSTIENNTLTGTVTSGANSTLTNNTITKKVTAQTGSSLYNNTIFDGVLVNTQNVRLIGNNISKMVNITKNNVYLEYNHICGNIKITSDFTNVTVKNNIFCGEFLGNYPSTYTNNTPCGSGCTAVTCTCHQATPTSHGNIKTAGEIIEITSENIYNWFDIDDGWVSFNNQKIRQHNDSIWVLDQSACTIFNQQSVLAFAVGSNVGCISLVGKDNPTLRVDELMVSQGLKLFANFTIKLGINGEGTPRVMSLVRFNARNNHTAIVENLTISGELWDIPEDITNIITFQNQREQDIPELAGIVRNCKIDLGIMTDDIDWSNDARPKVAPIYFQQSSQGRYVRFDNNTINLTELSYRGNYSTLWSIYNCNNHTELINNNMYLSGHKYLYAIENCASNTNISGNNIVVNGTHYTAGVYITGVDMQNNTVENNNITLYSGYGHAGINGKEEDSGYAVVIEDRGYGGATYDENKGTAVYNNKILNNNITSYGNNPYSIEHFGGKNTTIAGNNITAQGYNPAGIALTGVNVTIENNTIKSYALTNITGGTVDYFPAVSTGVLLQWSRNTTLNNNVIEVENGTGVTANKYTELYLINNNITTTDDYAVALYNVKDSSVTENTLIARTLVGDAAVLDNNGTNNVIQLNLPAEPVKEYSLQIDTTEFTQGTNATITASIYYGDDIATDINKGKVTFKVNGKTLKDTNGKIIYVKVVNGQATIENYLVPDTWNNQSTIEAIYSGSADLEKMSSGKIDMTVTPKEVTLTTSDITSTAGSQVQLTATLSDNTINTGKIVFKINGKTVKDENGKVIYAKVVNGQVTVNYTIPESMKTDTYTITAVYISSNSEKLTAEATLTVAKPSNN
ncbi:right-handed parallel beta-helix repeat-containing protein [Methanosphaera sp. BMS]|uniref:right-handed parallel beta-helix repeat-containing protein n=1 Tax=Methanosphaera sp. BMS TaxID=1789762 RepID=UPI000DC1E3E7|nr:right-handed parallel beta-helix repeat-containing protein [Methanosphaera sp. BMS]AWX33064.1 hypothetical protein AW729_08150 [Methanosphaera sp. BMS]